MKYLFRHLVLLTALAGCFHRGTSALRIGDEVVRPSGLDSIGTDKWIEKQRAACPGKLNFEMSYMPVVSLDGSPLPYHSPLLAVRCVPP